MSEIIISKEEIKKLSILSNLEVSNSQEGKLADMLSDTLSYVKTLDELNTVETRETFQVTGLSNIFQEDKQEKSSLSKEKALQNAREVVDGLICTKAVFDR